jgi:hypothetical protein
MNKMALVLGPGLVLLACMMTTGCVGYWTEGGDLGDDRYLEDMPMVTPTPGKVVVSFHENVTFDNATAMVDRINITSPEEIGIDDISYWEKSRWLIVEVPIGSEQHYADLFDAEPSVRWAEQF